jgi:hypothetical protein
MTPSTRKGRPGRVPGLSAALRRRYTREGPLYFSQPSLTDLPLETTANLFYTAERHPATAVPEPAM